MRGLAIAVAALGALSVAPLLAGCGGGGSDNGGGSSSLLSQRTFALSSLEQGPVAINGATFPSFIMDTNAKRQEGFMFVSEGDVDDDEAMLFVFADAAQRAFYMKNTGLPLDIAFIGADRRIVSIKRLTPFDESLVPSDGEAMYALEVKQGAFASRGVAVGQTVTLPDGVTARN